MTATPSGTLPLCATHDPTQYHALIKADSSCHYNHEHHNDPSSVNDIFGPVGAYWGSNQSISYPWQTFSPAGEENAVKHNGYKWIVRRGLLCVGQPPYFPGCVTDYRVLVHIIGGAADSAGARFHSAGIEARFCYPISTGLQCGIYRSGGWIDFGILQLETNPDVGFFCPDIPANAGLICGGNPEQKNHGAVGVVNGVTMRSGERRINWYGTDRTLGLSVQLEPFGDIDAVNPFNQLYFCAADSGNCGQNNSRLRLENVGIQLGNLASQTTGQGGEQTMNWSGYLMRHGEVAQGCTSASLDCIPTSVENLVIGNYNTHAPTAISQCPDDACRRMFDVDDTDTSPAQLGTGTEWYIQFPN